MSHSSFHIKFLLSFVYQSYVCRSLLSVSAVCLEIHNYFRIKMNILHDCIKCISCFRFALDSEFIVLIIREEPSEKAPSHHTTPFQAQHLVVLASSDRKSLYHYLCRWRRINYCIRKVEDFIFTDNSITFCFSQFSRNAEKCWRRSIIL